MYEIFLVGVVSAVAILITSFGDRTEFERTERIESHVETLSIQDSLESHREMRGEQ